MSSDRAEDDYVSYPSYGNNAALGCAAQRGHVEMVKMLIDSGAVLDSPISNDEDDWTVSGTYGNLWMYVSGLVFDALLRVHVLVLTKHMYLQVPVCGS